MFFVNIVDRELFLVREFFFFGFFGVRKVEELVLEGFFFVRYVFVVVFGNVCSFKEMIWNFLSFL